MGVYPVERTGLLIDGRDYYATFHHVASKATRYVLLAGWQFDTDVSLVRGDDAHGASDEVRLLPFLTGLCEQNPELAVYVLAWDFHPILSMDREWFQDWIFRWRANERVRFRFDSAHPMGASHHQKFAVIDGAVAFAGGLDICSNRWDDRRHLAGDPLRVDAKGNPYGPYHDIQSFQVGPLAERLSEVFAKRWLDSQGEELRLPPPKEPEGLDFSSGIPLEAEAAGVSRTQGKTIVPEKDSIREIRSLYLEAIGSAEELVYMENQYFSSQAVYRALLERMQATGRPKLEVVIILPSRPHAFVEEVSMGAAQARMLRSLKAAASSAGHSLGMYYSLSGSNGAAVPTYIHAKLLLVDDRFLTVGSANASNRSMGLDSELNVSWEASGPEGESLLQSIRQVRLSLLGEHTGLRPDAGELLETRGIVERLEGLVQEERIRLRRHEAGAPAWAESIIPEGISLDPEEPVVEENVYEFITRDEGGIFSEGIAMLNEWLTKHPVPAAPVEAGALTRRMWFPDRFFRYRWWLVGVLAAVLAVAALIFFTVD